MTDNLLEKFEKIKEQAKNLKNEFEARKLRGINEFNIFSVLRSQSDERRLHSRFIASLLNPSEKHYQKDLFLKLFLKAVGLENFINLRNAKVYREYENIDIYMTDGENHIILENKIYASDQEKQINRYINKIKVNSENKFVIYLSLDRENPSEYSLGEYRLNDENNKILDEKGQFIAKFKNIHYDTEIKNWLEMCLNEVGNITNLSLYIRDYSMVIDKIYGNYKELIMETKELWIRENYEVLKAITENSDKDRNKIVYEFLSKLKNKIDNFEKYTFHFDNVENMSKSYWGFNIRLNNNEQFVYRFEFDSRNCKKAVFGIFSVDKKLDETRKIDRKLNEKAKEKIKEKTKNCVFRVSGKWAWQWAESYDINLDFCDYIFKFDNDEKGIENFFDFFEKELFIHDKLLEELNKEPENYYLEQN